jgi:glycosyltransferase involved in cell wall biosynthesis
VNRKMLLIAPFAGLPGEGTNNRFAYIAEQMRERGWTVHFVTSSFVHSSKRQRLSLSAEDQWITIIREPGYSRNVSFRRLWSHFVFGCNLRKWLRTQRVNDFSVVYVAFPTTSAALAAAAFAEHSGVPLIVDVQDIWPDAFTVALGNRRSLAFEVLLRGVAAFWEPLNRAIMQSSSLAVAVSRTYAAWARKFGAKQDLVCYLGTEFRDDEAFIARRDKESGTLWVSYEGTLGHSYDIRTLLDAALILQREGHTSVRWNIIGDGPLKRSFEDYAKSIGVTNVAFYGHVPYDTLRSILRSSDVAVNAITAGSKTSLPNKVFDYWEAALPTVSSVDGELRELLEAHQAGLYYTPGNPQELASAVRLLLQSIAFRRNMGAAAHRLGREIGDRRRQYERLFNAIERVAELHATSEPSAFMR